MSDEPVYIDPEVTDTSIWVNEAGEEQMSTSTRRIDEPAERLASLRAYVVTGADADFVREVVWLLDVAEAALEVDQLWGSYGSPSRHDTLHERLYGSEADAP